MIPGGSLFPGAASAQRRDTKPCAAFLMKSHDTSNSKRYEGDPEMDNSAAYRRAHMPEGTDCILSARTLATDHRRLDELLQPGYAVLDVGCGNGAITAGILGRVLPGGRVVGVDINSRLIQEANERYGGEPGLTFHVGDIYHLEYEAEFQLVTCSRVLQWLAKPATALESMIRAAVPGGRVLVLDYNHEKIAWDPEPPATVRRFYDAFLAWRAEAGMDNAIADHLVSMFVEAGLTDVVSTPQQETTNRGDAEFERRIGIWADVIGGRGRQMVEDDAITEAERAAAHEDYVAWARETAQSQTLYLLAVEGVKAQG